MRINLGCGDYPLAGYVNCDRRVLPGVAVRCDVRALPFRDHAASEVYAGHLLEHLDYFAGWRALREWWRVVQPGGTLAVVTPDQQRVKTLVRARQLRQEEGRAILSGRWTLPDLAAQTDPLMHHHAVYDERALVLLLRDLPGVASVYPLAIGSDPRLVSHVAWQCGAVATKEVA